MALPHTRLRCVGTAAGWAEAVGCATSRDIEEANRVVSEMQATGEEAVAFGELKRRLGF